MGRACIPQRIGCRMRRCSVSDAMARGRCAVTSDIRASSRAWATYSNDDARQVVEALKSEPGPMLIALQALQQRYGYVDPDAVPLVAGILNVSRAEVYGVLTFYHDLRTTPAPRAVVRLCVAEACQAGGVARAARSRGGRARGAAGRHHGRRHRDRVGVLPRQLCPRACGSSRRTTGRAGRPGRARPGPRLAAC